MQAGASSDLPPDLPRFVAVDGGHSYPFTTWCAIEVWGAPAWPVRLVDGCSAAGRPVGDQPGDRYVSLGVVLATPDPALHGAPLFGLGDGMLDTDPLRGLLGAGCPVDGEFLGERLRVQLGWRAVDLVGERLGQPLVAAVHCGGDGGMVAQQVLDPLGLDGGLVVHALWADGPGPQGAAWPSQMVVVLMVFCLR